MCTRWRFRKKSGQVSGKQKMEKRMGDGSQEEKVLGKRERESNERKRCDRDMRKRFKREREKVKEKKASNGY